MINHMNEQRGFTLIELMIVVAVIGILASIGYPSYAEYVAKSRRATMTTALLQGQQFMERFYTENFSYLKVRGSSATIDDIFPVEIKQSPAPSEGSAIYSITLTVNEATPEAYVLLATRAAGMSADRCGNYQIDQYGRKTLVNFDDKKFASMKDALNYCWK